MLQRLANEEFDVLVVGGGITGAGCALDAASRGLRTALVERHDFASGTSSKSSKLVHGGIRYLQQREFALVYDALHERQRALKNAPHLVRVLPFLIPILSKDGLINKRIARALGTRCGCTTSPAVCASTGVTGASPPTKRSLHMPTCERDNVASAYLYYDCRTDDARLTLCLARTAATHGAVLANHTASPGLAKGADGRVAGATVDADGTELEIQCPRRRQRGRRVVRRGAHAGRGNAPRLDPPGEGHPHHGAVVEGPQRHRRDRAGPEGPAVGVRRPVG